ncbi:MAG: hypothetical protein Q8Q62_17780 [Mesorhizobium sp.]|nr:hypothetical protein [Mesorhizobium sp.]
MIFAGLLILAIVALGLFLYLELEEMALGAFASVVILAAIGLAFDLAAILTVISLLAIGLAIGVGYLVWRIFSGGGPRASGEGR